MHSLAELQAHFARALIAGADEPVGALLGAEPRKRLEIHRRHYAASLAAALRD